MTGVASVTKLFRFKNFTLLYFTWHIRDLHYCIPWHLKWEWKKFFFLMPKNYLIPSDSGYERVKALEECKTSSWSQYLYHQYQYHVWMEPLNGCMCMTVASWGSIEIHGPNNFLVAHEAGSAVSWSLFHLWILVKTKQNKKKNTKNQKPTQLDCWSSSAPDVTVFFMKDFLLLLLLKDFALGPSSISIASWVMKGNSVAIPSWIPLKWGRQ